MCQKKSTTNVLGLEITPIPKKILEIHSFGFPTKCVKNVCALLQPRSCYALAQNSHMRVPMWEVGGICVGATCFFLHPLIPKAGLVVNTNMPPLFPNIWLRLKFRKAPVPDLIDVLLVFLVWNACKTFKEGRQQSSSISGCRVMWCGIRLFDRRPFSTVRKLSGESHRQLLHLSSRFCFGPWSVHSLHDLASAASSMLGLDYQCSLLCGFCLVFRSTDNLSTYLAWQLAPDI